MALKKMQIDLGKNLREMTEQSEAQAAELARKKAERVKKEQEEQTSTVKPEEPKKRGRKPKEWNRLEARPIQKTIHFDDAIHKKINRVKNMINEMNDMSNQTTVEDIVYDAVVFWLDANLEKIKKKYNATID